MCKIVVSFILYSTERYIQMCIEQSVEIKREGKRKEMLQVVDKFMGAAAQYTVKSETN